MADAAKYLTFHLGSDVYAVEIAHVREVMGIQKITALPQAPAYVKGVIYLRGQEIPVVDLRLKFGLPEREFSRRTCIIVFETAGQVCGVIVDRVGQLLMLPAKTRNKIKILVAQAFLPV